MSTTNLGGRFILRFINLETVDDIVNKVNPLVEKIVNKLLKSNLNNTTKKTNIPSIRLNHDPHYRYNNTFYNILL